MWRRKLNTNNDEIMFFAGYKAGFLIAVGDEPDPVLIGGDVRTQIVFDFDLIWHRAEDLAYERMGLARVCIDDDLDEADRAARRAYQNGFLEGYVIGQMQGTGFDALYVTWNLHTEGMQHLIELSRTNSELWRAKAHMRLKVAKTGCHTTAMEGTWCENRTVRGALLAAAYSDALA